ncbi:hypothetical protein FB384_001463 [Prauserella sediminis]|uniref:Uncharacterized protein n=1 Tax=Prauserella sediminis TaxID=577680 RepID=A0A839XL47_9PSEU|nr:hypothetical protein [Prauserella sediminis]MBB3662559.1 hypothetical protein [Prauserella sediminis]
MTGTGDDRDDPEVREGLRRLFGSAELGAGRAPDPGAIVAGAGRRRRRRATFSAGAGVFVMVGAVAGGLALAGAGGEPRPGDVAVADRSSGIVHSSGAPASDDEGPRSEQMTSEAPTVTRESRPSSPVSAPPAIPTSTRPGPSPADPPPGTSTEAGEPQPPPTLGQSGKEPLHLLMTYDEAVSTGAMDPGEGPPAQGECRSYEVADPAISRVAVRGGHGIVRFQADAAQTPERIVVGSSWEQLNRAYPELQRSDDGRWARENPEADSRYVFGVEADEVVTLRLTVPNPDVSC